MTLIKSISGIRGTIGGRPGQALTPMDVVSIAGAFGMWLQKSGASKKLVIGRDARISGEMVNQLVVGSLISVGIEVIDLGLATTPTVEMAVTDMNAGGGIIITASHNPKNWNALKLLNSKGEFISDQDGKDLLKLVEDKNYTYNEVDDLGSYSKDESYLDKHIQHILDLDLVDADAIAASDFSVAVDAVNSVGGIAIPRLLKALGVNKVTEINCVPDGNFAHNPEPLPENIVEISELVKKEKLDLGIIVDPDVDRLALVCNDGTPFGEEYTLVSVADYVLQHTKGALVANLSSTMALREIAEKHGVEFFESAVGEVNVVREMNKQTAAIGGEGNGGVIYPELHNGRDALVGVALFLTYLAKSKMTSAELRATYPDYKIEKQKIELEGVADLDSILEQVRRKFIDYPSNTIDGLKITFPEGWVHMRKSNTEQIIRIYAEATTAKYAKDLAECVKQLMAVTA
ncbi:phosphoglucosamine mutase [Ancylomarina euxinus]|uniref:Phosphoglucosamine mutase n=1 Tax=Ancylomarina euxinus TaxID=2283627 RepID=A0A425Y6F3_9BACT|nr:phosphoglucosamine mutase [Ancylomarina euxinus]MCZ4694037.1 phosphoglucosamine mutase [Ancylomarina euxinus]MUP14543.1 phosphoglucosamine mutase [Ancylomarina euxinus]RRG24093.1 phosphoglucosamine mutase [Ancylomarina euxinus]